MADRRKSLARCQFGCSSSCTTPREDTGSGKTVPRCRSAPMRSSAEKAPESSPRGDVSICWRSGSDSLRGLTGLTLAVGGLTSRLAEVVVLVVFELHAHRITTRKETKPQPPGEQSDRATRHPSLLEVDPCQPEHRSNRKEPDLPLEPSIRAATSMCEERQDINRSTCRGNDARRRDTPPSSELRH